jgi:hypothetical protein
MSPELLELVPGIREKWPIAARYARVMPRGPIRPTIISP